jgi:hypothetical protein
VYRNLSIPPEVECRSNGHRVVEREIKGGRDSVPVVTHLIGLCSVQHIEQRTVGRWQSDNTDLDLGNILVCMVLQVICSALQIERASLKWRRHSSILDFYLRVTLIALLLTASIFLNFIFVKYFYDVVSYPDMFRQLTAIFRRLHEERVTS